MDVKSLLEYYDYLARLAMSKTTSQSDAEDLVSETMLAALRYIRSGGIIEHPKTFLANTLMHKINDSIRRKYRLPLIVNLDILDEIGDYDESLVQIDEEDNETVLLRSELIYLAKTTREVLIEYYFAGRSVPDIAKTLNIPEGTVKSRLSSGRSQIKKGIEKMDATKEKENYIPGRLNISNGGSMGPKGEPMSLVEGDLIVQNLLILAYDKPLTPTELARAIGIPTVYVEPILERLTDGELMVKTDGGRYYTDFIIYKPEDSISRFEEQQAFVHDRFDSFWLAMSETIERVDSLDYSRTLNPRQLKKLERYAVMRVLQGFEIESTGMSASIRHKERRDGGRWTANGRMYPAGYDYKRINEVSKYVIMGGHRTGDISDYQGAKTLRFHEFDTTLLDNPSRFLVCGFENYFWGGIIKFLWCIYKDIPLSDGGLNNALIENIDGFINVGLLSRDNGKISVDIPVMNTDTYNILNEIINASRLLLEKQIGDEFRDFIKNSAVRLPEHLKSVPEIYRYMHATQYVVMSSVYEAYERGLHLHDVDYCCPPCIYIY